MSETMQAVKHMAGEVIDNTSRQDFIASVLISSLVMPILYAFDQPEISLLTVGSLLLMWGYATMGLCVFSWVLKKSLGLSD